MNKCRVCGHTGLFLPMKYPYSNVITEMKCPECETRYGKWTEKILKEGECKKKYGGKS